MKVRLTRLSNKGNALRTDSVEGELLYPLEVGLPAVIVAEPLELTAPALRYVTTSPVVRIEGEDVWTENTHYRVEEVEE